MENKIFKGPDVKGKRYREKIHHILTDEFYKNFKEKYPKYKDINQKDLRKICIAFHTLFLETVIDNRDGVQLPEGLGSIFIGTCQSTKKKNIDFGKSIKYGVVVTNSNWETDNKLGKIFYTNYATKYNFVNRECWEFKGCRTFKRTVAKVYSTNWPIYIQVEPTKNIRKMFTKSRQSDYLKAVQNDKLKTYNEFDI
jgi:hypothetical protein